MGNEIRFPFLFSKRNSVSLIKLFAIDISPLKRNREFRFLFFGQLVSFWGTVITNVALSFQIYEMTKSTAYVGILGVIQLVPLSISGFIGGAVADRLDRKRIIVVSEILLAVASLLYAFLAVWSGSKIWMIFAVAAFTSFLSGFHRPALEATTPRLVTSEEIPAVGALSGVRGTTGMIFGPALAGIILSSMGLVWTYLIDAATFVVSICCVLLIRKQFQLEREAHEQSTFTQIRDGLRYAWERPLLLGTYFVDMASMTFAFPYPLYPELATKFGNTQALGILYAAAAVGSFIASITSGWITSVRRHGKTIALAAAGWCIGIIFAGFSSSLWTIFIWLAAAGFADMVSAMFRSTVWNQTIPDSVRGRLAGVEMLSYLSGPMLGGTLMGFAASSVGTSRAMMVGGCIGIAIIVVMVLWLKEFWKYEAKRREQ